MRIAYIAAGAGAMYCGACARDATLARGLIARGHDLQVIPLYTPMKLEEDNLPVSPVFFGGINVSLQQAAGIFRSIPAALDRFLDHPAFLRFISKFGIEIEAKKLGPMTVSMLAGTNGRQKKEVERLLRYFESGFRPDVINLTNSLLSGLAPELKRRLKVPVVCTSQGEDGFVADLLEPYKSEARELIRKNAQSIDLFICPSEALAAGIAEYLGVDAEKVRVIRTAVAPDVEVKHEPGPFTVGYLSVIRPAKGLDLLVEALRILTHDRKREVRLLVGGRVLNKVYWKEIQEKVKRDSLGDRFEYLGELDREGKLAFNRRTSVFCLPSRYAEPRGVAVLEAMAAGLPVVVPATGVYPELMAQGGGGRMVPPNSAAALAQAIGELMDDPAAREKLGREARELVVRHCSPEQMVDATVNVYQDVVKLSSPA